MLLFFMARGNGQCRDEMYFSSVSIAGVVADIDVSQNIKIARA